MKNQQQLNLYRAFLKQLQNALNHRKKNTDKSQFYQHHKDLNDYLVHQSHQQKQRHRLGRHL